MSLEAQPSGTALGLARFVRGCTFDSFPSSTVDAAKSCLLDWAGVALAAGRETEPAASLLTLLGDLGGADQATIVGKGTRTSAVNAALVNGVLSHTLDYDDVHVAMREQPIHTSAPVAPAVVAAAEWGRATGRETLAALIAGVDVSCRIARALGAGHYAHGWHATSTVGTVGASAAAGRVLGLDEAALAAAINLGAVQASGVRGAFGTSAKAFQAGRAAMSGLLAATLSRGGLGVTADLLDCEHGFFRVFSGAPDPGAALEAPGRRYAIDSVTYKRHASCGATHAAIDAVLDMDARPRAEEIAFVVVSVPPISARMAHFLDPVTPLQAKFSISHCTALALADGSADVSRFTAEEVLRPDVVALRRRIRIVEDAGESAATVEILTTSGVSSRGVVSRDRNIRRLATRHAFVDSKFLALAEPVLSAPRARAALDAIRSLDEAKDVAPVFALLG